MTLEARDRVLVVGGGLSGLATALGAALRGLPVTVLEAAPQFGGAAAYSGGQVWVGANHVQQRDGIADDAAAVDSYVRGISPGDPALLDEQALQRWLATAPEAMRYWEQVGAVGWTVIDGLADYHAEVPGALANGRYLTAEPVPAASLGEWRERLRISPHFRMGTTYADLFAKGRRQTAISTEAGADRLTFGTGVVAGFLARLVREHDVELLTDCRVRELHRDPDGRLTLVADGPDGPIRRSGPVVLATSTFDGDPELVREFLGIEPEDFGSLAPETLRGDAVRLARSVGADIARMPATTVPLVPGWRLPDGTVANGPEYAMPHAMIVDRTGRRFCNDSYWPDLVPRALDPDDPHLPMFLIWDEQHHRKYGLGATPPGGEYPAGLVHSAATLAELGDRLGIDGAALGATAARFSAAAERGEDPDFGRGTVEFINRFSGDPQHRPSPVLGPVEEPPFHGMRLCLLGTGIGMSGVRIDAEGRALDAARQPVPGLFAVGACAAMTASGGGYNSGFALARGLTLAYLVSGVLAADNPVEA